MIAFLDGARMTDRAAAHDHLAEQLGFPGYYGRNLDALYDLLTERSEQTHIIFSNPAQVTETLGKYGQALLGTVQEAVENNPKLTIELK